MRFQDLIKGKMYYRTIARASGGARKTATSEVYKMLIVDKNQDTEEIFAAVIPETGKPMAGEWFTKEKYQRWKTKKP